jgi:RIO-like serine/threonine protein kinase
MERKIKELEGHSGSKVLLMQNEEKLFIRKVSNIERNFERLSCLHNKNYKVPKIYNYDENILDMEYLHGHDMKTHLQSYSITHLVNFISELIFSFSKDFEIKDYTETYEKKLQWLDSCDYFVFKKDELIEKLPKKIKKTLYHGDLTLENIIHTENGFYLIDAVTVEYDSYVFDIAKLRQDLECKWFLRKSSLRLGVKLKNIQEKLYCIFPEAFDDCFLILMLLRVFLHTKDGDQDRVFLTREINKLWKNLI